MSTKRNYSIFIGDGSALPTAGGNANSTNILAGDIALVGRDMTVLAPGATISDSDVLYVAQGLTDGTLKMSAPINGMGITSVKSEAYKPAARDVVYVGYNRKDATGSIVVENEAEYTIYLLFKHDKALYSGRPQRRTYNYTSDATATQLEIANALVSKINADTYALCTAKTVGNGTGVSGLTSATAWGIEITADLITSLPGAYNEERVYMEVGVDSEGGFGATETGHIQHFSYGSGTYKQVLNMENFAFGYEGVTNRRLWPVATLTNETDDLATETTIVPTATMTTLEDKITFSASVSGMLEAGDFILIDNNAFEIKYFVSTTVAIAVAVNSGSTLTAQAVEKKMWYDLITIEYSNSLVTTGVNAVAVAQGAIVLAVPAGIAGSAYSVSSTQGVGLLAVLNPYIASTPASLAPVTL